MRKLPPNLDGQKGGRSGRIVPLSQEVPTCQSKLIETQIVSIMKDADAGRPRGGFRCRLGS